MESPTLLRAGQDAGEGDRQCGAPVPVGRGLVKPLDSAEFAARMRRSLERSGRSVGVVQRDDRTGHADDLSRREREILLLLAEGKTETEIAATLVLSRKTVATHIQNMLRKLGVHSRTQAVAAAYREGVVGTARR
jgi:DNA-binding NarL/FixJ family response regulator